MTREEMREAMRKKCNDTSNCCLCPLGTVPKDIGCWADPNIPDSVIVEHYKIMFPESEPATPTIKDSGERREFESGAVRDIQEGKGRCDLMPLDVVANHCGKVIATIAEFQESGDIKHLHIAIQQFIDTYMGQDMQTAMLEVAAHFEDGAKKYGEHNWQKGIPVKCYIDSAVRHYLKFRRGDTDERHDRAFLWNLICCIWTCNHKPELNDYRKGAEE